VAGGWRRPRNKELHNLHTSPNIVRVDKVKEDDMGETCSTNWREEKYVQYFGGKT